MNSRWVLNNYTSNTRKAREVKGVLGQGWIGRSRGGAAGEGRKKEKKGFLFTDLFHILLSWAGATPYKFFLCLWDFCKCHSLSWKIIATTDKFTSQALSPKYWPPHSAFRFQLKGSSSSNYQLLKQSFTLPHPTRQPASRWHRFSSCTEV